MITELTPGRTPRAPGDADWLWFWQIVDTTVSDDEDEQLARLQAALEGLTDQDLVDFIGLYQAIHGGLHQMRLWAAAYLINGGCSDDGFIDFRAWLISRGRRVAEMAMADPDGLAALGVEMDCAVFESFGYVMLDVYAARADGASPRFRGTPITLDPKLAALDQEWAFDLDDVDEMRRRLPRLAALYLP